MKSNLARELDVDKTSKVVQSTLERSESIAIVFVVSGMTENIVRPSKHWERSLEIMNHL